MLVHICCSVDSHYFIKRLKEEYPDEELIGYFYDPNIHPYSEYLLRFLDVQRSCKKLGIEVLLGIYDYEAWLLGTKNLEDEPEKGKRCSFCFDFRFKASMEKAKELGESKITSTLLMSPKKDMEQIKESLGELNQAYNLELCLPNFRKNGGSQKQFALAKEDKLYHQNYCGCFFALEKQRKEALLYELLSPLTKQILPASIEEKIQLYQKISQLEEEGKAFEIHRIKFLNYRLLRAYIKVDDEVLPSYFLYNSVFARENYSFTLTMEEELFYSSREAMIFLSLEKFNELSRKNFLSIKDFYSSPLTLEEEEKLREKLAGNSSLNPIIILEKKIKAKINLYVKSTSFIDFKEKLVILKN